MITPVYTQFPYYNVSVTGNTQTVSTASGGILHSVVIGKTTTGTITISDNTGTLFAFPIGATAGSYIFDCSYAAPLKVATTASDYVCVIAGGV